MIDTVIFDMDGVICHTNPFHSKAFQTFFAKRNMHPTEEEFGQHMYGKSNSYIFSHFFGRPVSGQELQQFEDQKEGLFREIYEPHIETIPGYLPFLEQLIKKDFKLGVATSAPKANMDLILGNLGIEALFGSRLASEDVTKHKPDPMVYLKSSRNLNAEPSSCIVFEDSYSGASAGLAAGMKVIGVLSSHSIEQLPPCSHYLQEYEVNLANQLHRI